MTDCCILFHLLCVRDTKQLISVVSVLFLLATTVSTRILLYTECSNYIYFKFTFTQRKVMENNFPEVLRLDSFLNTSKRKQR